MPPPVPLVPALRGAVFRGSTALAAGYTTRGRLRSPLVRRLFKDVYADAALPVTHVLRCRALAEITPPDAVFTGRSALALSGLDVVDPLSPVEVAVPHDRSWGPLRGAVVRRPELAAADITTARGLAVTTPLRSCWDVARHLDRNEAIVALDAALARWPVLERTLDPGDPARRRRSGGRSAGALLALADGLAESPMESRLRLALVDAGLPRPVAQHVVRNREGRFVARVDLAWPERRVAVEYDGALHAGQLDADRRRLNQLHGCGWTVVHVTAASMRGDPAALAAEVASALGSGLRAPTPRQVRERGHGSGGPRAAGSGLDGGMAELSEPEVDQPTGPAPDSLQTTDIVVGDGEEAAPGGTVQVHYVGVEYDSGEEFDSSWGRGEPIEFPLRGLIQGWQDGIPGMRVGGRRQLVVPPHLAYGPAGGGHRLSGQTLIFVIDLLAVR